MIQHPKFAGRPIGFVDSSGKRLHIGDIVALCWGGCLKEIFFDGNKKGLMDWEYHQIVVKSIGPDAETITKAGYSGCENLLGYMTSYIVPKLHVSERLHERFTQPQNWRPKTWQR